MLNYKKIKNFFKTYQTGYIGIVLPDCEFRLYSDVDYYLDETSITFKNITYTDNKCGNSYVRKGDFVIPFDKIVRIEYIQRKWEM